MENKQQRGYNKVPNITVRLTKEQYEWLQAFMDATGEPRNKVIKDALDMLRNDLESKAHKYTNLKDN